METRANATFKSDHGKRLRMSLAGALLLVFVLFVLVPLLPKPDLSPPEVEPVMEMVILDDDMYSVPQRPNVDHPVVRVAYIDEPVYEVVDESDRVTPPDLAAPFPAVPRDEAILEFDVPPRAWDLVRPDYPQVLRVHREEGFVTLRVRVDARGLVEDAAVLHSTSLLLERPTVEAVKQWRFHPAEKDGRPVAASITLPLEFRLQ